MDHSHSCFDKAARVAMSVIVFLASMRTRRCLTDFPQLWQAGGERGREREGERERARSTNSCCGIWGGCVPSARGRGGCVGCAPGATPQRALPPHSGALTVFLFFIDLKPRIERHKSLCASHTSPSRNRCTVYSQRDALGGRFQFTDCLTRVH